ncbi:MAG TPA: glycoside hydrolase family 44 protein [Verrucomicrobiae bacterium]|nr:glycoside hydrolase family 44 protein [Verrucomicrobiae bacterium]
MNFISAKGRVLRLQRFTFLWLALVVSFSSHADQIIYSNSLNAAWSVGTWATINLANTSPVHSSPDSVSVTASNYQGFFPEVSPTTLTGYTNLTFWVNGGSVGGQIVQVQGTLNYNGQTAIQIGPLPANQWKQINCSLSALGVANQPNFTGFWWQIETSSSVPTFYVDDIVLQSGQPLPPPPQGTNAAVTVQVDAQINRHSISPMIYGVAFATTELPDLNFTMNRSGGNSETRYNWQLNAHNLANDWYFESYPDDSATPGASADEHISYSEAAGAQPMMTIPMIGWMPKLGSGRTIIPSYSVAKYGAQTGTDPYLANAGNGFASPSGMAITNNDPNDANFPTNSAFQKTFVQHLIGKWGASTNGGVKFYIMDNEHSIWFSTHQDIHPIGPTMQEIRDKILDYASMVKSNDPNALVCGPEEFGWSGYFFSGYDQQMAPQLGYDVSKYPDRATNGGWDYMPWLLNQLHQHDTNTGQRLLDYFTLHCYPQDAAGNDSDVSTNTELIRNESTRQLWDPNYVDQSWIGEQVQNNILMLIPRMKAWVTSYYPGTKIGITEYNWGAEPYMNGATAQADILGIFGREGLDLATRWTTPATNTPTYLSMKIYRNYDGKKSTFGDTSVSATVPDPDNLSTFAAIRTNDSALTVMVINKTLTGVTPLSLNVTNFANSGIAQAWQITGASNAIAQLPGVPYTGGVLSNTLPAQSITLFVLPTAKNLRLRVGTNAPPRQMELWMDGQGGQRYTLLFSTNLITWTAVSTNLFSTNSFRLLVGTTNTTGIFYRGFLNAP